MARGSPKRAAEPANFPKAADRAVERVVVERISPEIDGGRFPIKRAVGERVDVRADIFADGHDVLAAVLRHRQSTSAEWIEAPMAIAAEGRDEWSASFEV